MPNVAFVIIGTSLIGLSSIWFAAPDWLQRFIPPSWMENGYFERTVTVDGNKRSFGIYIPQSAAPVPRKALFVFHGTGGSHTAIRERTGFDTLADQYGFVVIYPESQTISSEKKWDISGSEVDDMAFFKSMERYLITEYSGRIQKVYVAGMSNGGVFAQSVACRDSRLLGVAAVAAGLGPKQVEQCERTSPLKSIGFYGTEDHFDKQLEFKETMNFFAREVNGCSGPFKTSRIDADTSDGTSVTLYETVDTPLAPCSEPSAYYLIKGGGHFWPDGNYRSGVEDRESGVITHDINASELIVDFFDLDQPILD